MDIQINNQSLDFTIDKDETLGDVVKDLETWLNGSDMVLYSVKHEDQELLSRPHEQWAAIPHSAVGTLTVTVKHTRELALLNLRTILEYLSLLKESLLKRNAKHLEELIAGFPALVESVQKHFAGPNQALTSLIALLGEDATLAEDGMLRSREGGGSPVLEWPEDKREQAVGLIDTISTSVRLRLQELEDPKGALQTLAGSLETCIEEISEISILLSIGKDRQAMDVMIRFSELSQSLVRLVAAILPEQGQGLKIGGMSLRDFYGELNAILKELLQAFDAGDTVLIGDLMEYEVAPRLEQLRSLLQDLP